MAIHDWTQVDAGLFHHFHQDWTIQLSRALNDGILPPGYVALADQQIGGPIPDVLTLQRLPKNPQKIGSGLAVAVAPPKARFVMEAEHDVYAQRANRIRIQHRHGEVVAIIEVVSPGNKNSRTAIRAFVRKATDLISQGVHLLIVDLFPPSARDPQGIHGAIWEEIEDDTFKLPAGKPLTVAAYRARPQVAAYVEPVAVGDELPSLPIFLNDEEYVPAPLEQTYQASWAVFPADFKDMLEAAPGSE